MKRQLLKKQAFTLLELLFVIVVIGILAATIIPRSRTNPLQEAAVQLASHIKYTQHLAMIDDKYDASRTDTSGKVIWYKDRWQLNFSDGNFTDYKVAYTIFADTQGNAMSRGNANPSEVAINPNNPNQLMTGGYNSTAAINYTNAGFQGMKKLNIGDSYGIKSVVLSGGCNSNISTRISFDHLGRPMNGDQSTMTGPYKAGTQRLMTTTCNITLSSATDSIVLTIAPETGYVKINF